MPAAARTVLSAALILTISQALAQQAGAPAPPTAGSPAPVQPPSGGTPDKMPYDVPYGSPISLDRAKSALAAAEAEQRSAIGR